MEVLEIIVMTFSKEMHTTKMNTFTTAWIVNFAQTIVCVFEGAVFNKANSLPSLDIAAAILALYAENRPLITIKLKAIKI